mmetsp:Transcript_21148/g.48953  ORF Transcript_21148/g.48953 Transcript_21148/m.48953 type:complete len:276 (-) Transcript_21148:2-829(-)
MSTNASTVARKRALTPTRGYHLDPSREKRAQKRAAACLRGPAPNAAPQEFVEGFCLLHQESLTDTCHVTVPLHTTSPWLFVSSATQSYGPLTEGSATLEVAVIRPRAFLRYSRLILVGMALTPFLCCVAQITASPVDISARLPRARAWMLLNGLRIQTWLSTKTVAPEGVSLVTVGRTVSVYVEVIQSKRRLNMNRPPGRLLMKMKSSSNLEKARFPFEMYRKIIGRMHTMTASKILTASRIPIRGLRNVLSTASIMVTSLDLPPNQSTNHRGTP